MKGSCLCGGIHYEITGFDPGIANCHCAMCRKFSGSAFGVFGSVSPANLHWITGTELLKEYVSSEKARRGFCVKCGTSIYFRLQCDGAPFEIALGTLDDEPNREVDANIYFDSKPRWSKGFETLPSYAEERKP